MKHASVFAFATILLFLMPRSAAQLDPSVPAKANSGVSVVLALQTRQISPGEPLRAKIIVENNGDSPLLVGNLIQFGGAGHPVSRIEFSLRGSDGRLITPAVFLASDVFSEKKPPNASAAFMDSYLLLRSGYSISKTFLIDARFFKELTTPGSYGLSATYVSSGLSYPPVYYQAGLSEEDIKSIPFKAWNGSITTNEVRFRVGHAAKEAKR